jgi:hypothetical protein
MTTTFCSFASPVGPPLDDELPVEEDDELDDPDELPVDELDELPVDELDELDDPDELPVDELELPVVELDDAVELDDPDEDEPPVEDDEAPVEEDEVDPWVVEAFDEPPPVPFPLPPQPAERASVERTAPAVPARTKDTRSVLFCTSLLLTKVRATRARARHRMVPATSHPRAFTRTVITKGPERDRAYVGVARPTRRRRASFTTTTGVPDKSR